MMKLSVVCFVLLFEWFVIADNVPVLVWGPYNYDTPAIALKSFDGYQFYDILNEHMTSDTFTLVALEEQLSTEDLSECKAANGDTCFQGIQRIKNKLYLTSVQDPMDVIDEMAGFSKFDISIYANGTLSEQVNAEGGKFVFINFEDTASNDTKSTKLTRHDSLITKLSEQLSSQNLNFMVIYTGKGSKHQKRYARQVQQSSLSSRTQDVADSTNAPIPVVPSSLFKSDQVWLYYTRVTVGEKSISFKNMNVTKEGTRKLLVTLSSVEPANTTDEYTTLSFNIVGRNGYWWVLKVIWDNLSLSPDTQIYARDKFSYHCSLPTKLKSKNRNVILKFHNFQIQSQFTTLHRFNRFYDAYDCIGFVSPGILSGLLVSFMLLFILIIGISCLMNIKTMDRFDDPKGKTITVTNDYDS